MRLSLVPLAIAGLALTGCSNDKFVGRTDLNTVNSVSMPRPSRPEADATIPYVIGALDRITVDVAGLPDVARELTVDPSGQISVPLAGSIRAAGLTPTQLAARIRTQLKQNYVRDPQVSVNVAEVLSKTVTVDGEVKTPGIYAFSGPITLVGAIARAQGVTEFATTNYVVVYRTVDDQKYAGLYDLRAIRAGEYIDPEILPNDVVVVGESRARRTFKDVLSASGLITAPLILLLQ